MSVPGVLQAPKDLFALLYTGSPREQLRRAEALAAWLQQEPMLAAPLRALLPQLQEESALLAAQMQALGMGEACSACAARSFGGCCSAYMAGNSDVALMVLNLLLGATLQPQEHIEDACCFLSASGCMYVVKPIFCLNFYCGHLKERTAPADMQKLEAQAGRVLGLQCAFEERLLQLLRSQADVPTASDTPDIPI